LEEKGRRRENNGLASPTRRHGSLSGRKGVCFAEIDWGGRDDTNRSLRETAGEGRGPSGRHFYRLGGGRGGEGGAPRLSTPTGTKTLLKTRRTENYDAIRERAERRHGRRRGRLEAKLHTVAELGKRRNIEASSHSKSSRRPRRQTAASTERPRHQRSARNLAAAHKNKKQATRRTKVEFW